MFIIFETIVGVSTFVETIVETSQHRVESVLRLLNKIRDKIFWARDNFIEIGAGKLSSMGGSTGCATLFWDRASPVRDVWNPVGPQHDLRKMLRRQQSFQKWWKFISTLFKKWSSCRRINYPQPDSFSTSSGIFSIDVWAISTNVETSSQHFLNNVEIV